MKSLSRVWLFVTPWTITYQAPPSMGFSRQEYWSGLPFPSPGIFPTQRSNPGLPHCRQTLYRLSHQELGNSWIQHEYWKSFSGPPVFVRSSPSFRLWFTSTFLAFTYNSPNSCLCLLFSKQAMFSHTFLCLCTSCPFTGSILFNIVNWNTPTYNLTYTHTHRHTVCEVFSLTSQQD